MNDLVSRQAVDELSKELVHKTRDKADFLCNFWEGLSKLPSVNPQPKTKWIPVSERLPEEREWIGTKQFGTTISDEVYVTLETPDGERFTRHLHFQNGGLSQNDKDYMRVWYKGAVPIAWMPLPSPFEPQERE